MRVGRRHGASVRCCPAGRRRSVRPPHPPRPPPGAPGTARCGPSRRAGPRAGWGLVFAGRPAPGNRRRAGPGARSPLRREPRASRRALGIHRPGHLLLTGERGGGAPCRRLARGRGRRAHRRRPGRRSVRAHHEGRGALAAAGPPRPPRARHGVLPAQQRRRGRRARARAGAPARGRRRLGRAPRKRHAGDVLRGPARPLSFDTPAPLLSGHRGRRRGRPRAGRRLHRERAAGGGQRRRGLRRGVRARSFARARGVCSRAGPGERGLRRVGGRPAGADGALGGMLAAGRSPALETPPVAGRSARGADDFAVVD